MNYVRRPPRYLDNSDRAVPPIEQQRGENLDLEPGQ